jgi:8-oxo-dGTP pyrophosphatase MutT (NUDIX family)
LDFINPLSHDDWFDAIYWPPQENLLSFHPGDPMTDSNPRSASVLVINPQGQVLVVSRKSGNGVCMPGGKVDEGEDFICAATRETHEETGLHIPSSRLRLIYRGLCPSEDGRHFDTATFLALHWTGDLGGIEPELNPRWSDWSDLVNGSPFRDYNLAMAREGFFPYLQTHTKWTPQLDAWMQAFTDHVDLTNNPQSHTVLA